jgi:hypothetical protein
MTAHRDTEPRIVLKDVVLPDGRRIPRGTIMHVPAGSVLENDHIGPCNLAPLPATRSATPTGGATN